MSEIAAGGWEDTQDATSGAPHDASAVDPDAALRPSPPDGVEPPADSTRAVPEPPADAVNDDRGTHQTATAATTPPPVGDNATTPAETAPTETAQSPDAGELTLILPDPTPALDQLQDAAAISASSAGSLTSAVENLDPPTIPGPTIARPDAAVATDSDTPDDVPTDSVDPVDADPVDAGSVDAGSVEVGPGVVESVYAPAGDAPRERDLITGSTDSIDRRKPGNAKPGNVEPGDAQADDAEADLATVIAEVGADDQADAPGDDSDATDQQSDGADRESDLAAASAEVTAEAAGDLALEELTSDSPDGSEDLVEAAPAEARTAPDSDDGAEDPEDAAGDVLAGLSAAGSSAEAAGFTEAAGSAEADGPVEAWLDDEGDAEETTLTDGLPTDRTGFDPDFGVAAFAGAAATDAGTTGDKHRPGPAVLGGQRDRRKWIHVVRHGYVLRSRSGLTVVMVVVLVVLSLFGVTGLILFGGSPNSGTEKAVMFAPSTAPDDLSLADLPQPVPPPAAQQPVGQPGPPAAQARAISHADRPAAGSGSNGGAAQPIPPAKKAPTTTTRAPGTSDAPAPTSVTVATSTSPRCASNLPAIENLLKLLGNC